MPIKLYHVQLLSGPLPQVIPGLFPDFWAGAGDKAREGTGPVNLTT